MLVITASADGLAWASCQIRKIADLRVAQNVPGIHGACATRNFTYLVRGPYISARQSAETGMTVDLWVSKVNAVFYKFSQTESIFRVVNEILHNLTRFICWL